MTDKQNEEVERQFDNAAVAMGMKRLSDGQKGKARDEQNLLSEAQKEEVRDLFLVGGYSFNAAKATDEESRRVEMRLEFLGIGEPRPAAQEATGNFGECAIK